MNWAKQHESTGGKLVIDWDSLHARFNPENGAKAAAKSEAFENVKNDDETHTTVLQTNQ